MRCLEQHAARLDFAAGIGGCAWDWGDGWVVLAAGRDGVCASIVAEWILGRAAADGANCGDGSCAGSLADCGNADGSGAGDHGSASGRVVLVAEVSGEKAEKAVIVRFRLRFSSFRFRVSSKTQSLLLRAGPNRFDEAIQ